MKRSIIVIIACMAIVPRILAEPIDLTTGDVWVTMGFPAGNIDRIPLTGDNLWTVLRPTFGKKALKVRDLALNGLPAWSFADIVKAPPVSVTFLIPFQGSLELLNTSDPAIYFAQIGVNWAIYLNGTPLQTEIFMDSSGRITRERSAKGAIVLINKAALLEGQNVLAVRVIGDPTDDSLGMALNGPYMIDRYSKLVARNNDSLDLMFIGIYFFFSFYHIILFILRPKRKFYMFYALGTLTLGLFLLARGYSISAWIPDSGIIRLIEYVALFMAGPLVSCFFETLIRNTVSPVNRIYLGFSVALCIPLPFIRLEPLLYLFLLVAILVGAYMLIRNFLIPMGAKVLEKARALRGRYKPVRLFLIVLRTVIATIPGQLLIIITVLLFALISDLPAIERGAVPQYSKFGFLALVVGTAGIVASEFMSLYIQAERMSTSLESRVTERTKSVAEALATQERLNAEVEAGNRNLAEAMTGAERDMKIAITVQRGFFPKTAPDVFEWDIAFEYRPASGISGDLYDFHIRGGQLVSLVVGEVSGYGIAAGLITVLARSIFHHVVTSNRRETLGTILHKVNNELSKELSSVENDLSAVLMRFEGDTIEYINASHLAPIVRKAGVASARVLEIAGNNQYKGVSLGRGEHEETVKALKFSMKSGDAILLYTAGFPGSSGPDGEHYGLERILKSFSQAPAGSANDILKALHSDFAAYLGDVPIKDDVTVVVMVKR